MLREAGGFTPLESITSATSNGARVLGIESRTGTVRVGLEADLVVCDDDPLADSKVFFEPRLVVSDGRIVLEGAAPRPPDTRLCRDLQAPIIGRSRACGSAT